MFDVVAAHQHQLALTVERKGVDEAEAKIAVQRGLVPQKDLDGLKAAITTASDDDIKKWRRHLTDTIWSDAYLDKIHAVRKQLKDAGVDLKYGN